MKLACIADIHSNVNYIEQLSKLDVDAILIAGDLTQFGTDYELEIILKKLNELNKDVIFIAGNHDMFAQTNKEDFEELVKKVNTNGTLYYLKDSFIDYCGVTIYGTPYVLESEGWAFNLDSEEELKFHLPRKRVDILLTHIGIYSEELSSFDTCFGKRVIGSKEVTKYIKQYKPLFHISGHIHECGGKSSVIGTTEVDNVAEHIKIIEINKD